MSSKAFAAAKRKRYRRASSASGLSRVPDMGSYPNVSAGLIDIEIKMWVPTQEEVVEMYARHFEALHRSGAAALARDTAAALEAKGDSDGHKIWNEVADAIDRLSQTNRIASQRQLQKT
jgi:hypothetical protein